MIKSFKHKGLERYWTTGETKLLPQMQIKKIRRVLDAIDSLNDVPKDFEPFRSWRPHQLQGEYKGYWSLDITGLSSSSITATLTICFIWTPTKYEVS